MKSLLLTLFACASTLHAKTPENPVIIDDAAIMMSIPDGLGTFLDKKEAASPETIKSQLDRKICKLDIPQVTADQSLENVYDTCADGVVIIGMIYKCDKCEHWHSGGAATAWTLSADGVMVTNYHVFDGGNTDGFGIRTRDGRFAPVTEILAANKEDDVVIFKVAGDNFTPIPLGKPAAVGSELSIISHPDSRFFSYTQGRVSRYSKARAGSGKGDDSTVMNVTAEFAHGSSGGPAINNAGQVVGMVASTNTIYYPSRNKDEKQGPAQMVIHNCVPVSAIWSLIEVP